MAKEKFLEQKIVLEKGCTSKMSNGVKQSQQMVGHNCSTPVYSAKVVGELLGSQEYQDHKIISRFEDTG